MKHRFLHGMWLLLALGTIFPAAGDAARPSGSAASTGHATVLWYEVQEPGTAVYPVKTTVTDSYVRMDDDDPESGYILFDRDRHAVYSVNHEEKSILEFSAAPAAIRPPASLGTDEVIVPDKRAPPVGGRQPVHVQLQAGGSTCYEIVVVPGLLAPAAAALAGYAQVLAARQLKHLDEVPADIRTPCYLLRYVYGAGLPYRRGMPIREWDSKGYRRVLVDYRENMPVDAGLFVLPAGYERYRMDSRQDTGSDTGGPADP
jgi:hypothetical protein